MGEFGGLWGILSIGNSEGIVVGKDGGDEGQQSCIQPVPQLVNSTNRAQLLVKSFNTQYIPFVYIEMLMFT